MVQSKVGLNVRSGPRLADRVQSRLAHRQPVSVTCRVRGQQIVGSIRTTTTWVRLTSGGYASDAFLSWTTRRAATPSCSALAVPAGTAVVNLPFPLNVRSGPATSHAIVSTVTGSLRPLCQAWSQAVNGNPVWYQLGVRRFVTAAFVRWPNGQPRLRWCGAAAPSTPASNQAFLASVIGPAQASARKWKVPASVTIAQAILESGWGRSPLAVTEHNLFGMKCFGDPGAVALGCTTYATRECAASRCYSTRDSFRAYRRVGDSFEDHGRALARLPYYKTAMRYAATPNRFALELQRAGYATAPAYAAHLVGVMRDFNLYRYDLRPLA
ncbi:flagellar protein FlgJ [Hamadaea flava]|uniref:Sporangiospore maturation cell wall hydrolase GsmA n=1 Tax=Hamadaea flava TaxID=1742688 RepID=A0ABV8LW91_9ACTN|nr:sporangiospore maturation cell wall hydrolase GsmA [Hamadaea flava]MCP2328076.1 flagellar protein FlgJ [Hamadaea flava]